MSATISTEDLAKMKVQDLKRELKSRDLSVSGNKGELLERLEEALKVEEAEALLEDGSADDDVPLDKLEEAVSLKVVTTPKAAPLTKAAVASPTKVKPAVITSTPTVAAADAKVPVVSPAADESVANSKPVTAETPADKEGEKETAEQKKLSRAERFGIVSDDTAKSKRAERFGIVSDDDKKAQRAAKFGLSVENTPIEQDDEKKSKRAERFGVISSQTDDKATTGTGETKATTVTETKEMTEDARQRLLKRKERFGEVTSDLVNKVETDEKIKQRAARFGAISGPALTADEEAKKKKRMDRFAAA